MWPQGREGSNPFFRTIRLGCLRGLAHGRPRLCAEANVLSERRESKDPPDSLHYAVAAPVSLKPVRTSTKKYAVGVDRALPEPEVLDMTRLDDGMPPRVRPRTAEPAAPHDETFPPVSDGDPAANPPRPLDDMAVPPLTEPTDVNGG